MKMHNGASFHNPNYYSVMTTYQDVESLIVLKSVCVNVVSVYINRGWDYVLLLNIIRPMKLFKVRLGPGSLWLPVTIQDHPPLPFLKLIIPLMINKSF